MTRVLKGIFFILVATGFSQAQAEDAKTLRFKMNKLDKQIYETKTSMKQEQTLEVNGQKQTLETKFSTTSIDVHSLKKVIGENIQIRTENKKLNVQSNIAQLGDYAYDSESDENDSTSMLGASLTPLFDVLNGAELSYTMTPQGEVTEYKSYQELLADALKNNPIATQFLSGGSEDSAKMELSQGFPFFSKKPVKKGDKWEQSIEVKMDKIGSAKGKRIFTYAGTETVKGVELEKITVILELTLNLDIKQGGSDVTGTLEVTESSGTFLFDNKKGRLVSSKLSIKTEGDLTVTAGGMEIPIASSQTQTVNSKMLDKIPE